MKFSFVSVCLFAALALIACDELSGNLTLQQSLSVVTKNGETVLLPAGTSPARVEYKADKKQIDLKTANNIELKIRAPDTAQMPRESGSFFLSATDIQQNFDLRGRVNSSSLESEKTRTVEDCYYHTRTYTCTARGDHRSGRRGRQYRHCGYNQVHHRGSRSVEYHFVTTTAFLSAELLNADQVIGELTAARTTSQKKVYDLIENCR